MEKAIIEIKEIFNKIGSLELEEHKIQKQLEEVKKKNGIKKADRLYAFGDFSKVVQKIYKGSKLDKPTIEVLFTDMLSEPSNVLLAIKYISNTMDSDMHPTRNSAFGNILDHPDLAESIIGRFTLKEVQTLIEHHQDYWMNKYGNAPVALFTLFLGGIQYLKEDYLMKLITMLGEKNKIEELTRLKMTSHVTGDCLEKLDSYLVLEKLRKGSI